MKVTVAHPGIMDLCKKSVFTANQGRRFVKNLSHIESCHLVGKSANFTKYFRHKRKSLRSCPEDDMNIVPVP